MDSERTEQGLEDVGITAEGPSASCLSDTEGHLTNEGPNSALGEVHQLDGPRELGEGEEDGGTGREAEVGSPAERPGPEPGESSPRGTPAPGAGRGHPEGDGCATTPEPPSPGAAGEGESSLGAEGQGSVPPSLSMTSLSRSITKEDVTSLKSLEVEEVAQSERGRDIGRSQTVPRSFGAQSRRAAVAQKFEKMSPTSPASGGAIAKLQRSTSSGTSGANTVKQRLLEWCRGKTRGYEFVDIQNFSCSWNDGMAFCALVHKFFPDSFDYSSLNPKNRRQNFALAFSTAEARADCYPLIEVDDMVRMGSRPDAKCVFTYVQSLCQNLRKLEAEVKAQTSSESR